MQAAGNHAGELTEVHPCAWVGRYHKFKMRFSLRFALRHALPLPNGEWDYTTSDTRIENTKTRPFSFFLMGGEEEKLLFVARTFCRHSCPCKHRAHGLILAGCNCAD